MLPICSSSGIQSESVTAYQCTSDYVQVMDPPAISLEHGMIRVCIDGSNSSVECQKVLESTIKQASKSIEEAMVVNGQQQRAFTNAMEVTAKDGKCMLAAFLTDKYFIRSTLANSLKLVVSGSVSIASANSAVAQQPTTTSPDTTTVAVTPAANWKKKDGKRNDKPAVAVALAQSGKVTVNQLLRGKANKPEQRTAIFEIAIELAFGEEKVRGNVLPYEPDEVNAAADFYDIGFVVAPILALLL